MYVVLAQRRITTYILHEKTSLNSIIHSQLTLLAARAKNQTSICFYYYGPKYVHSTEYQKSSSLECYLLYIQLFTVYTINRATVLKGQFTQKLISHQLVQSAATLFCCEAREMFFGLADFPSAWGQVDDE